MIFTLTAIIIYKSIPLLETSGKLSIFMPNAMNIAFYMPTFLKTYLGCGIFICEFKVQYVDPLN